MKKDTHRAKQELRRELKKWSTVSYAISILGVLGSVPATLGNPLSAGGPATAVWCWFFGSFFAYCIAASGNIAPFGLLSACSLTLVAELSSAYPTAGGMYFVTKHVVPPEHMAIWAWVVGWCNFLGQTAGVSSVAYTVSQMILACASMNSAYEDGAYAFIPYSRPLSHVLLPISGCVTC
jgi:amino acid transporter